VTIAAVLLAAGPGSRFEGETHKLLAEVRGKRLVDWAVQHALDAALDDLIVVYGAVDLEIDGAVRNDRWEDGLASSLRVAVKTAAARGHDAVVVAHGDQPGIGPSAWRTVADCTAAPIVRALYEDGTRGHPVRLSSGVWPLLPARGGDGAGAVMRERRHLVAEVACQGDPTDVDTLEDLHRWS
jgi:molybdenum cofactor cytidylyltransferase